MPCSGARPPLAEPPPASPLPCRPARLPLAPPAPSPPFPATGIRPAPALPRGAHGPAPWNREAARLARDRGPGPKGAGGPGPRGLRPRRPGALGATRLGSRDPRGRGDVGGGSALWKVPGRPWAVTHWAMAATADLATAKSGGGNRTRDAGDRD